MAVDDDDDDAVATATAVADDDDVVAAVAVDDDGCVDGCASDRAIGCSATTRSISQASENRTKFGTLGNKSPLQSFVFFF